MALRPTTDGDLPTLHALFLESIAGVYRAHRFEPPAPPLEVFAAQQAHVLATGVSVVAEESGEIVGFGSAWTRGDDWFLASLFVSPSVQGRGVGTALLGDVWGDARRRRTITDAIQPASNALYARRGLVPATPVLAFAGVPSLGGAAVVGEAGDCDLATVDRAAYGFDRRVDHELWSREARLTVWDGAYSYVFPGGAIGPVAGATPERAAAALAGELARAEGEVRVRVPGSSRRLVEVALAAGLELSPTPGLLLLSLGLAPPQALAIGGYTLF